MLAATPAMPRQVCIGCQTVSCPPPILNIISSTKPSMEIVSELEAVFQSSLSALQLEEEQQVGSALEQYYLARSRVRYVLEALLQPFCTEQDPDVAIAAEACHQLDSTFSWVIQRLTAGSESQLLSGDVHYSGEQLGSTELGDSPLGPSGERPDSRGVGGHRELQRPLGECDLPKDMMEAAKACMRDVVGSLDDVVGLAAIKQELREAVLLPMHLPHLFTGIRRPQCNIMFHGVPGTGKTMLVEKIAAEAGIPLLCISPSSILSKWSGESEKTLRAVFEAAAQMAPALIFIDEIDSLAPTRSAGDDLSSRRVFTELLIQMTAVTNRPNCLVFVMACTNRLEDCDPALLRRFDRKIEVPVPDTDARRAFFLSTVQRPEISSSLSEEELASLAEQTDSCTGSDLAVVVREAALAPLRELMAQVALVQGRQVRAQLLSQANVRAVTFEDFAGAVSKLRTA